MAAPSLPGLLGIEHPIVQAGMARKYTSARLVAAVSESGALGILGCLGRPAEEVVAEIRAIRTATDKPFGVNFVLHRLDEEAFDAALAERVPVFSFFRGDDPSVAVARAHDVGAMTIHQVTTTAEALRAARAGVDVIVAQGTEAGGHCGHLPLSAFFPDVVRVIGDRPVVAAGGIVDGSGLAAAVALGASGVLMGTRFLATTESPASPEHKRAIVEARAEGTLASDRFDVLWGDDRWPGVSVRALKNQLAEFLASADDAYFAAALDGLREDMANAIRRDDPQQRPLLAGMGSSRIDTILPVRDVVERISREAGAQ